MNLKPRPLTPREWEILVESQDIQSQSAAAVTNEEKSAALRRWNEFARLEGNKLHITPASDRYRRN
ncbi:MAG: hypothetical protein HYV67_00645 [Candidatus Taylorbacteria bacterium]|nr:hypothetical protein [Candidatus Taylorbacteria bacterium]